MQASLRRSLSRPGCHCHSLLLSRRRGFSLFCRTSDPKVIVEVDAHRPFVLGHDWTVRPVSPSRGAPSPQVLDSLPRFPTPTPLGLLRLSDYVGTAAFAVSGSITAATVGMDVLGATLIGTVTAIGGGTVRDAVILHKQPFWVQESEYFLLAAACAGLTFLLWPRLEEDQVVKASGGGEGPMLWWGDALGVGAFAVIGAMNGARMGVHPLISVSCGMVTATFGGLTRDVICGLPKETQGGGRILHSVAELYASTALVGAATYMALFSLKAPTSLRVLGGVGSAMALRVAAVKYQLKLPVWSKEEREGKINRRRSSRIAMKNGQ